MQGTCPFLARMPVAGTSARANLMGFAEPAIGPEPLTPPIPRRRVESRALMQMVNELGRDADFDEQSSRQ